MRIPCLLAAILLSATHSSHALFDPAGPALPDGVEGVPYPGQPLAPPARPNPHAKFTYLGSTANFTSTTWRAVGVPPGLTFSSLGILSGKPTKAGNYTVRVSHHGRPRTTLIRPGAPETLLHSVNYTLTVTRTDPPTIAGPFELPLAQFDQPYTAANRGHQLTASGGVPFTPNSAHPTGYNWTPLPGRLPSQRLPQGMTLSPRGVISGTPVWSKPPVPSTPQTYTIQVRATDSLGKFSTANFTLVVQPPEGPEIITECPLPSGLEKDRYPVVELKARKGKPTYRWPKPINLPPGLVWSEKGFISGTPSVYGNFTIDLRVIDANGLTANKTCLIVIRPAPELDCPNIPCARVGDTLLPVRLAARGGDLPYRFSATNPPFVSGAPSTLPPGLSINATTGIISGNFTGGGNLTYNATFTVRDNANRTANKTCPIVVRDRLAITTASPLPFGIRGFPYPGKTGAPTVSINATGGWPPYNFQRIAGLLPDGLSINPNTGVISGTPTKTGTFKFTIRVKDSCDPPAAWVDKEFEIPIYDPITVFPQPSPCLTVNRTFSLNLTASGGAPPYVWSNFTASSQNYSLSVPDPNNSRTARVDGTPSQAGPVFFTVNVTSLGITETFTVNYTVHPELKITSDCPPAEATVGRAYIPQNFQAIGGTSSGNYTWNATVSVNGTIVHRRDWSAPRTDTNPRFTWTPSVPPGGFTGSGDSSGIDHSISLRVADDCGNSYTKNCTVTVYPALTCNQSINLSCLYNGTDLPETKFFHASGGKPPYSWNLLPYNNSSQILPNGLFQKIGTDSDGSYLYGTIAQVGNFTFVAKVSDSLGNECSKVQTISIYNLLDIIDPGDFFGCAVVGNLTCTELTATGGRPPYSWEIVTPIADLVISQQTLNKARICGTFPNAGNFTLPIKVSDANGCSRIEYFPFQVYPPLQITTNCPLISGSVGQTFSDNLTATGGKPPYTWQILPQLYVSDFGNNRIRKFYEGGNITTYAGNGVKASTDGNLTSSSFSNPYGMGFDPHGNIYVADFGTSKIRKISASGNVTTVGGTTAGYRDGPVSVAQFNQPEDMAADDNGNIYVADYMNHRIRKIDNFGNVTTIAGSSAGFLDGNGTAARFNAPQGICWDLDGELVLADYWNHAIRKISISGNVLTEAGTGSPGSKDGTSQDATFDGPHDVKVGSDGTVYLVDAGNRKIRKIGMDGKVSTMAEVTAPNMLSVDRNGFVYVSNTTNHLIHKITPTGIVSTIAGRGGNNPFIDNVAALAATFNSPRSIEINPYEDLPIGLTLNATTGLISGTPKNFGQFAITYRVTDSCGNTAISKCNLTVNNTQKTTFNDPNGKISGNVYRLTQNQTKLKTRAELSFMTPATSVKVANFDIPNQSFTNGFPSLPGLFEWFQIKFDGFLKVSQSGNYTFMISSDDGGIFRLFDSNGLKVEINNDGVHPMTSKISNSISLDENTYRFELDYFQGPQASIGLQLFWKKEEESIFTIIPKESFVDGQSE